MNRAQEKQREADIEALIDKYTYGSEPRAFLEMMRDAAQVALDAYDEEHEDEDDGA